MHTRRLSRRLFLALLVAVLWLGFLVEGSHALFTDQVSLTGNSISSGTTNLLISNSQNPTSTIFEKSRAGFAASLSPGEVSQKYFLLKNSSDSDTDFKIGITALLNTEDPHGLTEHTKLVFDEIGADGNPTGNRALVYLASLRNAPLDTPFVIPKGTTHRFLVSTSLDPEYTTQGESIGYDLIFTGTQLISS